MGRGQRKRMKFRMKQKTERQILRSNRNTALHLSHPLKLVKIGGRRTLHFASLFGPALAAAAAGLKAIFPIFSSNTSNPPSHLLFPTIPVFSSNKESFSTSTTR